jgi:Mn-dependent DtxR family transcriptional regulator
MTTRRVNLNTESVDNYLKAIFALGGIEEERVTSTALAERLGVAPASITNMLQKLASASPPLVQYERHKGVRLSSAGRRRALEIVRHHRLLEAFLYEVLDYPIEEVHDEAERLEHFISERLEERIDVKLGRPKFDPHGHCIPALDGQMAVDSPHCDRCDGPTIAFSSSPSQANHQQTIPADTCNGVCWCCGFHGLPNPLPALSLTAKVTISASPDPSSPLLAPRSPLFRPPRIAISA